MSELESLRLDLQGMIGRAWLMVHNAAGEKGLTPEFREELRQCASLLHQAERCVWARPIGRVMISDKKEDIEELLRQFRATGRLVDAVELCWAIAEHKGFHDGKPADRDQTMIRIGLLITECVEAMQEVKKRGLESPGAILRELVDVFVRLADLVGTFQTPEEFVRIFLEVSEANMQRPRKYGTPDAGEVK